MESLPIAIADIAVIFVLLLSGLFAFMRGLVREVLAIGAWLGAAFATLYGIAPATAQVQRVVDIPLVADIIAGAGVFIVSLVALSLISRVLSRGVKHSSLGALDRSLGFLFGLVRGAVLVSLIYMGVVWFAGEDQLPGWVTKARTLPLIEMSATSLKSLLPETTRKEGAAAARNAEQKIRTGIDMEKLLRGAPPAPNSDEKDATTGYNPEQRRALEKTIRENQ